MSIIELKDVSKVYPDGLKAVDHFNLEIESGEWVSIMGPSGSGKTTLLNMIGLMDRPSSGSILINDRDTSKLSEKEMTIFRRQTVGLIFQQFHMVQHLTALENVMLAQYFHSMVDEQQAVDLMARIGLKDRLHHLPSQLSGGEQQRVCIARALINEPKLLLADEPTGNLDEENEKEIIRLLMKLHQEGLTILMVTHDLAVGRMATRQIEMSHGRLASATFLVKQIEDDIDDALEQLWILREEDRLNIETARMSWLLQKEEMLSHLKSIRLVQGDNGSLSFTPTGEVRARDIIRRHRLGEVLFAQTFGLDTREASDEACQLEHIISPDVAERICTFLGHPRNCPHGHDIPRGKCCK